MAAVGSAVAKSPPLVLPTMQLRPSPHRTAFEQKRKEKNAAEQMSRNPTCGKQNASMCCVQNIEE